jgi:hypothetical protein
MEENRPSASAQRPFCACAAMTAAQETGFLSGIPSNTARAESGAAHRPYMVMRWLVRTVLRDRPEPSEEEARMWRWTRRPCGRERRREQAATSAA